MARRWRTVLVIFLTTRVPLFLIAWMATYLLASGTEAQPGNLRYLPEAPRPLQAWVHWDADWYLLIADRGYGALEEEPSLGPRNRPEDTSGLFPLYPWSVRAVSWLLWPLGGTVPAALLVSNLSLLGFLFLLHSWTASVLGEQAGRGACVVACTFPTSLFLSAPYAESLFLLLALGAMLASRGDRNAAAAGLAAAAALTRPVGVLLALPLAWGGLQRQAPRGLRWRRGASALGPLSGLLAYTAFCHLRFGDPLAFLHRQERWRGALGPPWTFLAEFLRDPHVHGRTGSAVDLTVALLSLALLPVAFRRVGTGVALYCVGVLVLPLSSSLFSFSRLVLAAFPLFLVLGSWWPTRPWFRLAYLALCLPFAGWFMALYGAGWWVG